MRATGLPFAFTISLACAQTTIVEYAEAHSNEGISPPCSFPEGAYEVSRALFRSKTKQTGNRTEAPTGARQAPQPQGGGHASFLTIDLCQRVARKCGDARPRERGDNATGRSRRDL